jgi:hypothetical protein
MESKNENLDDVNDCFNQPRAQICPNNSSDNSTNNSSRNLCHYEVLDENSNEEVANTHFHQKF